MFLVDYLLVLQTKWISKKMRILVLEEGEQGLRLASDVSPVMAAPQISGLFALLSCLLLWWLLLRRLQHDFTRPPQLSQFDFGVFCSVQRHLTVFPG